MQRQFDDPRCEGCGHGESDHDADGRCDVVVENSTLGGARTATVCPCEGYESDEDNE